MSHRSALLFSHLAQAKTYSSIETNDIAAEEKNDQQLIDLYIKEINRYPMLTKEQEVEYITQALELNCSKARQALIEANLRLVVRIARRYKRQSSYLMDLIAEGNIGLIHALNKFDPTVGCRFSTYASWWVQQYIEAFLMNNSRTIRLPVYVQKKISKIKKSQEKINQKYQRDVSTQQLAEESDLDRNEIDKIMSYQEHSITLSDDSQQSIFDNFDEEALIPEVFVTDQEHQYAYEQLQEEMRSYLVELPAHYRDVIARRFGLIGHDFMTFKEISIDLDLTIDQVRQRYTNAIKRLSIKIKK